LNYKSEQPVAQKLRTKILISDADQRKEDNEMRRKKLSRICSTTLAAALVVAQFATTGFAENVFADEATSVTLSDADFTGDFWNDGVWTLTPSTRDNTSFDIFTYADDEWLTTGEEEGTTAFHFWMQDEGNFTLTQIIAALPQGSYTVTSYVMGESADVSLTLGTDESEATSLGGYNTWNKITNTFTVSEDQTDVPIGFSVDVSADGYGYIDHIEIASADTESSSVTYSWKASDVLTNGDFESADTTGWSMDVADGVTYAVKTDSWMTENATNFLNLYNGNSESAHFGMSQEITLPAGTYKVSAKFEGAEGDTNLTLTAGTNSIGAGQTTGYNIWNTVETEEFTLDSESVVSISITGDLSAEYWGDIDDIVLYAYTADSPEQEDTAVESSVYVEKVNLTDNFITGADVSSYLSLYNSGAKFYDYEGNELDPQGFFNFLAANGTNWIRLRVWNDPYNSETGVGYGGGNNDLAAAIKMGKWATNAGMRVLIDFHYSDFWADPGKQQVPKAWADMNLEEKTTAITNYTTESLNALLDAGVDVGMVQIGNETTNSFCGESNWENRCTLFSAGANAVRAIDEDILIAIHFTNPERSGNYANFAAQLDKYSVDYDVFASSYYPYWHGTLSNLQSVLSNIATTYDKKVMVAETSWAYTLEDGDGHDNTVREGSNDTGQSYDFTEQGQANEIRSVVNTIANTTNGIGVFYWEAAWIPVQYAYDENGNLDDEILASNKIAWETNGSGWASSSAAEYDADDAGKWYGGSAVDNQAWFDFTGHPIVTASIYNLIRTGATTPVNVSSVKVDDITIEIGDASELALPETATVTYSTGTTESVAVTWEEGALEAAIASGVGTYQINGSVTALNENYDVVLNLTITPNNLIENGSFESGLDGWSVTDFNTSDASSNSRTGSGCMHFYTASAGVTMTATYQVTVDAGIYSLSAFVQGGGSTEDVDVITVSATVGDEIYSNSDAVLSGWKVWSNPTVNDILVTEDQTVLTVTLSLANTTAGVWGSFDDVTLYRTGDYAVHTHTAAEAVKENEVAPSCTENGSYDSVVYCEECGEELSRETIVVKASGHDYANPVFKWSSDYSTCTVTYTCTHDASHTVTYQAKVTKKVTAATTKSNGKIVYTATYNGDKNTKTVVIKKIKSVALSKTSVTYNGKSQTPSVTVKDANGKTISSKNYKVTYTNNKKVGTATVTVKFSGKYSGTVKKTFKILPKATNISKVKAIRGGYKITWKKQTAEVTGYQIQYSTSKTYASNVKTLTVKGSKTTSKTVTGLKAGKKYYVRIRTYKVVNGKKYYSAWHGYKI